MKSDVSASGWTKAAALFLIATALLVVFAGAAMAAPAPRPRASTFGATRSWSASTTGAFPGPSPLRRQRRAGDGPRAREPGRRRDGRPGVRLQRQPRRARRAFAEIEGGCGPAPSRACAAS